MDNPWAALTADHKDFVLDIDRATISAYERRRKVRHNRQYKLHADLPPTPFLGDPEAPVVLLSRNPSFDPQDPCDYQRDDFRNAAILNLDHAGGFFTLGRQFSDTASYREYWNPKLSPLIGNVGRDTVLRGVFCVQAFPYHALKYDYDVALPSQRYTVRLLRDAVCRGALVIGMMNGKAFRDYWLGAVPELRRSVRWVKSARTGTISRGNLGRYVDVVSALRG